MTERLLTLAAWLPNNTAALINAPHHLCYLTGFPSGDSWVLVTADNRYFLTDFRYIELAQHTVRGAQCCCITKLTETLSELLAHHNVHTLLIENTQTTVAQAARLQAALPTVTVDDGCTLDEQLSAMRAVKSAAEIAEIERAQALTEAGFTHILSYIREGVTEREVALELELFMRRHGAQQMAFDVIAVSGVNGAQPHGIPSDKPLCRGEFLTLDFGAVVNGYHADMTRTVALGAVSDEQHTVYQTVLNAQEAALAILQAGLPCTEGDAVARRVIEQAGYGDCFGHGTGHGVGVEIHESPRLSPHAGEACLAAGNVVTVEPGIYVAGKWGVRIEDMVLVTDTGIRNLTHAPKELLCL